jgi:hypothetical protein
VFVSRTGSAAPKPSRFATYSVSLGSPAGSTTGGTFRFSCSAAQAPCRVSLGAAVLSNRSGQAEFYPRILIHKEDSPGAPMTFCEHADGANNRLGIDRISRVQTPRAALVAMQTPLNMGIGGTLDCGAGQTSVTGTVKEILVPASSNGASTAFYDVSVTLQFR